MNNFEQVNTLVKDFLSFAEVSDKHKERIHRLLGLMYNAGWIDGAKGCPNGQDESVKRHQELNAKEEACAGT